MNDVHIEPSQDWDVYRCPRTGAKLIRQGDALVSSEGGGSYPIKQGVPCFLRFIEEVERAASHEQELTKLNRISRDKGWRAAVTEVYGANSSMLRYVDTPQRASFLDLLPIDQDSTVLEVGIGFAQITTQIAQRVKKLFAIEVRFEQALFGQQRCAEESIDNVQIACGGDDCRLPYANDSIDVVILNLVLEWCASRNPENPGERGQQLLLSEARRVLKPGGVVYVATKNRYALRLLLGKPDEHVREMPFGHALPGWVMRLAMKWHAKGKTEPIGTLHSYGKLRAMLRKAGLTETRSYWATPEMRFPEHYVATDVSAISEARLTPDFPQGEYKSTRLLMPRIPAAAVKYFTPGLLFIAKKPQS